MPVFVASLLWACVYTQHNTMYSMVTVFLSKYVRVNNGRPTWPPICTHTLWKGFVHNQPFFIAFIPSNDSSRVFPSFIYCMLCTLYGCWVFERHATTCMCQALKQFLVLAPSWLHTWEWCLMSYSLPQVPRYVYVHDMYKLQNPGAVSSLHLSSVERLGVQSIYTCPCIRSVDTCAPAACPFWRSLPTQLLSLVQ